MRGTRAGRRQIPIQGRRTAQPYWARGQDSVANRDVSSNAPAEEDMGREETNSRDTRRPRRRKETSPRKGREGTTRFLFCPYPVSCSLFSLGA